MLIASVIAINEEIQGKYVVENFSLGAWKHLSSLFLKGILNSTYILCSII